jgi:hypothetical protein
MRLKAYYQDVQSWEVLVALVFCWIGLRENRPKTMVFYSKNIGCPMVSCRFALHQVWCREMHPPHYPIRHVAGGPKCLAHAGDSESVQIEND